MSLQLVVIIPGPNDKKKIDKTAAQIARTPDFKQKLISRPEFSFLLDDDKFNPYYLQKLEECKMELSSAATTSGNTENNNNTDSANNKKTANNNKTNTTTTSATTTTNNNANNSNSAMFLQQDSSLVLRDTLPDDFSIPITASGLPALEIDLIQLAAQHAAVYGDAFVHALLARSEGKKQSLDFLNPDHSHYAIFAKIRDSYIKILGALASEMMPKEAAMIAGSREVRDVPPAHVTKGQNDLITRLELLAGELKIGDDKNNNVNQQDASSDAESIKRGREAFLIECNAKKTFMVQEDTKRRNAQMTDTELLQRLNWEQFVVKGSFSLADLKLRQ